MPSILFIDYHFPTGNGRGDRTLRLLQSLSSREYHPLVVAGPAIAGGAALGGAVVHNVDGNGNWVRAAVDAVDAVAARSAALLAVLSQPESAFVAAELAARWDVPWVADVPDPGALASASADADGSAEPAAAALRSVLGSAHALTVRTPEAVAELRLELPELGLKHVACVPDRPGDIASAPGTLTCMLGQVLEQVVPRRLRSGQDRRHLRVVSHAGH